MKCLEDFINEDLSLPSEGTKGRRVWALRSANGLQKLCRFHFVIWNQIKLPLPQVGDSHSKTIERCVLYLLDKKLLNNVLTYGYKIAGNSQINTRLHCRSTNSSVSELMMGPWELLHEAIGTGNFVELLINCSIFSVVDNCFRQLTGNILNEPHQPPSWYCKEQRRGEARRTRRSDIGNEGFLYRNVGTMNFRNLLSSDGEAMVTEVFGKDGPRHEQLRGLVRQTVRMVKRTRFAAIVNSVCPRRSLSAAKSNLDIQTDVKLVIRLITLLLDKIIPIKMIGSKKNKRVLFKRITDLIKLQLNCRLSFEYVMKDLCIGDVEWVSAEDFATYAEYQATRQSLFENLIDWYFRILVPRLIRTIFYATEISSQVTILYFRQDSWRSLTKPYVSGYVKQYLKYNIDCTEHDSFKRSKYNHRRLRIIPKTSKFEFRVLAVPFKGNDDEDRAEYEDYIKTMIKPIQHILNFIRTRRQTHFEKLSSPLHIGRFLTDFKNKLIAKYGEIPPLYFFKFDISSCYDSIPISKVFKILEKLTTDDSDYYIRKIFVYDLECQTLRSVNVVNGHLTPMNRSILIDSTKTEYFTKEDIINTLYMEICQTSLKLDNHCYQRKIGLFQGAHLSSSLVDIVYDDLLEYYREFRTPPGVSSLVLRLADDFMLISTSKGHLESVKKLALEGFTEYNATVNNDKMSTFSSLDNCDPVVSYCAMQINILNLQVWKDSSSYNLLQAHICSTKHIYKKLRWLFELRTSYEVTSLTINTWEAIVQHVKHVCISTAESFIYCFAKHPVNIALFSEFMNGIVESAFKYCRKLDDASVRYMELRRVIFLCFRERLLIKRSKYDYLLEFLSREQNTC